LSANQREELAEVYFSVAKRALQSVAIDFVMEGENYDAAIGMLHFHMAAFPMHFNKA
jgi:hypothetical protein